MLEAGCRRRVGGAHALSKFYGQAERAISTRKLSGLTPLTLRAYQTGGLPVPFLSLTGWEISS